MPVATEIREMNRVRPRATAGTVEILLFANSSLPVIQS